MRPAVDGASANGSTTDDASFASLPDLVIIDGGKGQLSAVVDVMREMGVKHIPTVGLAKQHEEIYVQDVSEPVVLPRTVPGAVPGTAPARRGASVRHHLPPRRAQQGRHAVRARYDPRRGPEAEEGAAAQVRLRRGHPGGDASRRSPRRSGFTMALAEKVKAGL